VNLFYGESGALVKFLINTYGKDKFAEFFGNLRNNNMDESLRKAYGFDQVGFENAWRQSVGLPPSGDSTGSSSSSGPQAVPTIVPFGSNVQATPAPQGGGGAGSKSSGGSTNPLVYVIGILVVVLVLTVGGVVVSRKSKSGTTD